MTMGILEKCLEDRMKIDQTIARDEWANGQLALNENGDSPDDLGQLSNFDFIHALCQCNAASKS